eukprot:501284-Rhodomonas_salina.1
MSESVSEALFYFVCLCTPPSGACPCVVSSLSLHEQLLDLNGTCVKMSEKVAKTGCSLRLVEFESVHSKFQEILPEGYQVPWPGISIRRVTRKEGYPGTRKEGYPGTRKFYPEGYLGYQVPWPGISTRKGVEICTYPPTRYPGTRSGMDHGEIMERRGCRSVT